MPIPFEIADVPSHFVSVLVDPIALAQRDLILVGEVNLGRQSLLLAGSMQTPTTPIGAAATKLRPWSARAGVRRYVLGHFDTGVALGCNAGWAGYGLPANQGALRGHPVVDAYVAAKATFAVFTVEARAGATVGGTLKKVAVAPLYGVGLGASF